MFKWLGRLKWYWKALLGLILVLGAVSVFMFVFMVQKDAEHFESDSYVRTSGSSASTVVVYFSRNGHTQALARALARTFDADLVEIKACDYPLNLLGFMHAASSARNHDRCEISPDVVDLSSYDTVFLGAPIWLRWPAAPLWSFVEKNDFTGKKVTLFATMNHIYKQEAVDAFKKSVEERGGEFQEFIYLKRGRIFSQLGREEFLGAIGTLVENELKE